MVKTELKFNTLYNLMAYLYIGCFVILGIVSGFSPIIFVVFILISMIFILPSHLLGLYIIIFMTMIFERWFTLAPLITEYSIYKIYPLDIIIIISILGWVIHQVFRHKNEIIFKTPEKILAIFIIINTIYLIKSFYEINADIEVAFSTFKNYAFYPLLYFLTIYSIETRKQLKNTIHIILLAGIFIIGFIITGFLRGEGLWTEYTPLSTSGVRFLAGTHAFYLILSALIASSLLAFNRFRNKAFSSTIIAIWIIGIIVSLMRHLWLSFAIGLVALFIFIPTINRKNLIRLSIKGITILMSLILILVLVINLFPLHSFSQSINNTYQVFSERIISIASGSSDTSINWRINFWDTAKKSWLENPVFGLGFGRKLPLELGEWKTFEEIRNIHNSLLAITIQMGIVGITLFGLFVISSVWSSTKLIFKNKELKPYYIGILAGIVSILFASLFQPYFETNLTGIFFWIFLGLLRTSVIINKQETPKI